MADLKFDKQLTKINGLKWLPWVGDRFDLLSAENRLLIVGESHYLKDTPESKKRHDSPTFTREVIEELAIKRQYYNTKIFQNLHRALFRNDDFDSQTFWNLVSFYNFIQRPMETNEGRPTSDDFYQGWLTFFETIKVLKPKTCLFIGTGASNLIQKAIPKTDFEMKSRIKDAIISGCYPKRVTIKSSNDQKTDLIFIRHTSQMFSWQEWNGYLQKKIPNELNWFSEQLENATT